jgi:hypothetical protein
MERRILRAGSFGHGAPRGRLHEVQVERPVARRRVIGPAGKAFAWPGDLPGDGHGERKGSENIAPGKGPGKGHDLTFLKRRRRGWLKTLRDGIIYHQLEPPQSQLAKG